MRISPTKDLFILNRTRLAEKLPDGAFAAILSNNAMPTNADGTHPYVQNSDLYYLTGILQEETILLMYPTSARSADRQILFILDRDPVMETWNGKRLSLEEAREISGIENVQTLSAFPRAFHTTMNGSESVYLNTNEHTRRPLAVSDRSDRFARECRDQYPLHDFRRLAPILRRLRMVKSEQEIELLKEAVRVTGLGFERMLKFVKPGVMEYEVEAELVYEYLRQGARTAGYEPIVASGINACTLHYVTNDARCQDGDLLLVDAAAGYSHYNADMTRTVPVNGRFSPRQRQVYDAVLKINQGVLDILKPGLYFRELQKHVLHMMGCALVDLGLIAKEDRESSAVIATYFPHGNSHFLGLDVHDVGDDSLPFPVGAVLTNEPGIYIRDEGIGVRLENNILLTESGNLDLMANIPIDADEIEALMYDQAHVAS